MGMLNRLYDELLMVEEVSEHEGYLYSASDTLLLLILGMLCGLPHIDDIHDRAKSKPTGVFLSKRFGIENIPCRAQIYNILKSISVCLRSKHTEMLVMAHCFHPFYSCSHKHYYIGFLALSHFILFWCCTWIVHSSRAKKEERKASSPIKIRIT